MVEFVLGGDDDAIDDQLLLLLVESPRKRLQLHVVAAVTRPDVVGLELLDGLGVQLAVILL